MTEERMVQIPLNEYFELKKSSIREAAMWEIVAANHPAIYTELKKHCGTVKIDDDAVVNEKLISNQLDLL